MPKGYMMIEERARKKTFKRVKEVYVFSKYWSLVMKCNMGAPEMIAVIKLVSLSDDRLAVVNAVGVVQLLVS